jgi:predicted transcriptional regulator
MTKLLEKGIEAVRALPAERQNLAGEMLLAIAAQEVKYTLTPEQLEDVRIGLAEAERGEFATDEEVAQMWAAFEK